MQALATKLFAWAAMWTLLGALGADLRAQKTVPLTEDIPLTGAQAWLAHNDLEAVADALPYVPQAEGAACPVPLPETPDVLDDLLARAELNRRTLGWPDSAFAIFGPAIHSDIFRLPFYNRIHRRPLNTPGFVRALVNELDGGLVQGMPVTQGITSAAERLGFPIGPPVVPAGAPAADTAPLAHALEAIWSSAGGEPDVAELTRQAAAIPEALQRALVPILYALNEAVYAVEGAYAMVSSDVRAALRTTPGLFLPWVGGRPNPSSELIRNAL